MPIPIVFLGTPAFALPALETLAADERFSIVAVVTQPDRPAGRGHKLMPPPIKTAAMALNLPVFQTTSIRRDEALKTHLRSLLADFFVTVAFGQILTQEILDMPRLGTVNAHASLLPEFRGANPIQQAILQGKSETGVTTMLTELGVDTGPMVLKRSLVIQPGETLGALTERLSQLSGPLLVDSLLGLANQTIQPEVQNEAWATHAPKCDKAEAILDWMLPAQLLALKVQAFHPNATTFFGDTRMKIIQAVPYKMAETARTIHLPKGGTVVLKEGQAPGTILYGSAQEGLLVQTGEGILAIQRLQPAGKKDMAVRDWLLGQGQNRDLTDLGCFSKELSPIELPA